VAPPARGGVTIIVTDMSGAAIRNIRVQAVGPIERSGTTDGTGQLRIAGMPAGTYRLRFSGDAVVEFEREVVVKGGPNTDVDVSLRPAPPPVVVTVPAPAPAPAPAPLSTRTGPVGQPQTLSVTDLVTKTFLEGSRKEVLLSCSANTRTTLVQLSADQPERLYDMADVTYYVIGGEGAVRMSGRETEIKLDSFVSVPRGVGHTIIRRGRRPLIVVTQLSGEPCEQAK
jgi:mannose-6-phosphate isomerase-like protein (cupin superfamily)